MYQRSSVLIEAVQAATVTGDFWDLVSAHTLNYSDTLSVIALFHCKMQYKFAECHNRPTFDRLCPYLLVASMPFVFHQKVLLGSFTTAQRGLSSKNLNAGGLGIWFCGIDTK